MVISARFGCQLFSARLGSQIVNFPSCCCGLLIELGLPHLLHLCQHHPVLGWLQQQEGKLTIWEPN